MQTPLVSVIIPNYNHAFFLKERLDSIFNQTFKDFEVILLDDASTDNSVEIIKDYSRDKRVSHIVINKNNSGSPFKQWKKGLDLAKGDYIWIAESDDSCELNFLETHLNYLKENDISVAKTIVLENFIKSERILRHSAFRDQNRVVLSSENFSYNCPLFNVSSMVFKKNKNKKIEDASFSKYSIIGDMVFYYEFFLNKKIIYNEETINYYREHDKGVSSIKTKSLQYYKIYFNENVNFINKVFKENSLFSNTVRKQYIIRRYKKIKNRTTFNEKLSYDFFVIFLRLKKQMIINL
ncbi:glycosyltransferase involved in cell wall biosynthesis [Lutibacter oceani]|uniref:Glycosyltransferase involved in cell wall biosynthesis n=1 Tax=Lutibacter oceani TaxID=1853311 RepID=A0A3D9RY06_9FLAO|nr:glycosyltransferase family 2 protein [Lutibacter oceani]REE81996.1 glycosyltransferase involved in cell wall biosynthesis [Lutibacter oceani]